MGNGMCKEMWPGAAKGHYVGPPRPVSLATAKTLQGAAAVTRNNAKQVIHNFPPMAPEPPAFKCNNNTITSGAAPPPEPSPPSSPPPRPPRRKRPQRKIQPALPPPVLPPPVLPPPVLSPPVMPPPVLPPLPRVHSALSLTLAGLQLPLPEGSPSPERQQEIHKYLRRCHSYGAVPALIEEMAARLPSPSTSSSSSGAASPALPVKRLPASSATPPPSPSSTPPHSPRRVPRFFIGARSASSSSNAQDPPSPGGLYLRGLSPSVPMDAPLWAALGGGTRKDAEHQLRAGLRRAKSQGTVGGGGGRGRNRGGPAVAPLTEHVIEMMPTAPAGPPVLHRALSSPAIREGEPPPGGAGGGVREQVVLLRTLGDGLPSSGGEEKLKAALERGLRVKRAVSLEKGTEEGRVRGEEDEDSDWLEDTPSLGELEDALAQMLEEEEWVLELERKAAEIRGDGEDGEVPARREDEQEAMKRVNTFMALSALSRNDD